MSVVKVTTLKSLKEFNMIMHKYTTQELTQHVWVLMANGYTHNANTALYALFDAGVLDFAEANWWVWSK